MYCLRVKVYCHGVTTQFQLINISYEFVIARHISKAILIADLSIRLEPEVFQVGISSEVQSTVHNVHFGETLLLPDIAANESASTPSSLASAFQECACVCALALSNGHCCALRYCNVLLAL
jgi:hypothetical protein